MERFVEKPDPQITLPNLAVVGRYILTPAIFGIIEQSEKSAGEEIQLTHVISDLLEDETILAFEFEGTRYDCGSKLGFLIATVEYDLLHKELRDDFFIHLKDLSTKYTK